jgi:glycosyltransferase involved in cell wall biosynthesis
MTNPSISVVTVTLNSARDLPRLMDSLRAQSDRDFEHVVSDGGSKDGTWDIVESSRDVITYAVSEPDRGLYDALNKGLRAVRTEYYLVMGADDVLYPPTITNFKAIAQQSGADVVVAGVKTGDTTRRGLHVHRAWLGHAAMITSHSVGMLFRTRLHERFGDYPLRYPILADGYFIKRVCTAKDVKAIAADFVAGEFGMHGCSARNLTRTLCESWQIQLDTGESPLVQYLLFQMRLLRNLPRIIGRLDSRA